MSVLPALITTDCFLASFAGSEIFYKSNPGNAGDALIAAATFQLFEKHKIRWRLIHSNDDLTGKTVFYAGGGNLVPEYESCASFMSRWHKKCRRLVILPHTVYGHQELISSLANNVTICCRDHRTYEYISTFAKCGIEYVSDVAFELDILRLGLGRGQLNGAVNLLYGKTLVKKLVRQNCVRSPRHLQAMRLDVEKTCAEITGDNVDVSQMFKMGHYNSPDLAFTVTRQVMSFLSRFSTISTNRLHIAIGGALLGRKVRLFPNAYFKIEAVYETSLKHFPNITLVKSF